MQRLKVLDVGSTFIVTEDLRAWRCTDYKKTFMLQARGSVYLIPLTRR